MDSNVFNEWPWIKETIDEKSNHDNIVRCNVKEIASLCAQITD